MATEGDMAAMKAELVNLTSLVKIMEERLQNQLDPKIIQYDEMLTSFATLSGTLKEDVQNHIQVAAAKQKIANDKFDDLYQKASASITDINAQIAALTASGGKGKGGNK